MITSSITLLENFKLIAEYEALLDYASDNSIALPNVRTRRRQNGLMRNLISVNYHSQRAAFWVMAGDSDAREFATLNWINPSTHRLTEHGTLSYSSLGFQGNGTTGYLNTHFNPASDGAGLYTLNAASIDFQLSGFLGTSDSAVVGLRNAAGTAQILATVSRVAVTPGASRIIMNDATNDDYAGNEISRGLYFFERISSANKQIWRKRLLSGNLARTSVAVPSGDLYLLARNSLSTAAVDVFSSDTIALCGIGDVLHADEKIAMQTVWNNYYLAQQEPIFGIRPTNKRVIYYSTGSGWDGGSIFGEARYNDVAIYGGTDETGSDVGNYDVGAFNYTGEATGSKDAGNPIFLSSSIVSEDVTTILPYDKVVISSTIYWFCVVRDAEFPSTTGHDIALMSSPTSDPTDLTYIGRIIESGGSGHFNHAPKYFDNPDSTTYHHIIYAYKNVTADRLQLNIARCLKADDITDPGNWSVLHSDVVALPYSSSGLGQVYPDLWYDTDLGEWVLLYGRFRGEQQTDSFSIFSTSSASLSSFPVGKETVWPTGTPGDEDAQYTSLPRIDRTNKLIYYSGRIGGAAAPYTSRLVRKYTTLTGFP